VPEQGAITGSRKIERKEPRRSGKISPEPFFDHAASLNGIRISAEQNTGGETESNIAHFAIKTAHSSGAPILENGFRRTDHDVVVTVHRFFVKGRHDEFALPFVRRTLHARETESHTTLRGIIGTAQRLARRTKEFRIAQHLPIELRTDAQNIQSPAFSPRQNRAEKSERAIFPIRIAHAANRIAKERDVVRGRLDAAQNTRRRIRLGDYFLIRGYGHMRRSLFDIDFAYPLFHANGFDSVTYFVGERNG